MAELCPIAYAVAEAATANNLKLSFKSNTLLSLVGGEIQSEIDLVESETKEELSAGLEQLTIAHTPSPFSNPSLESDEPVLIGDGADIASEAVCNDIVPIAQAIIDKTRNVFIPLCNDLYGTAFDRTTTGITTGGLQLQDATDGMENPVWKSSMLVGLLDSLPEVGESEMSICGYTFPDLDVDQLTTIIDQADNALLSAIKAQFDDGFGKALKDVYDCHFLGKGDTYDKAMAVEPYFLLLGILLSGQFISDIPEGVKGSGDNYTYSQSVGHVRGWLADRLVYIIERSNRATEAGQLVMSYPSKGSEFVKGATIVLNGRLLSEWVDDLGGSIDIIYGAFLSDGERNGEKLLSRRDYYERQYAAFIATARQAQLHAFETSFVKNLYIEIQNFAKEKGLQMHKDGIDRMFERESAVTEETAYSFTRKCVYHILFPEEDFLTICNHIDHIFNRIENISLDDAIPLAITDWLIEWAVEQINLH